MKDGRLFGPVDIPADVTTVRSVSGTVFVRDSGRPDRWHQVLGHYPDGGQLLLACYFTTGALVQAGVWEVVDG